MEFLRAFGLAHWLLITALVAGIGWHYADRHAAVAAERATWETKIADATAQAKLDSDTKQARIDELAKASNPALKAQLDRQQKLVDQLVREAGKPPHAFKPDCTLPADQVAAYNGIK